MKDNAMGIDIDIFQFTGDVLSELKKNAIRCLGIILICVLVFLGINELIKKPSYYAATTFIVNPASDYYSTRYQETMAASKIGRAYSDFLMSDAVLSRAAEEMGVFDPKKLGASIEASFAQNTNVVTLKVKTSAAESAGDLLQSVLNIQIELAEVVFGSIRITPVNESILIDKTEELITWKKALAIGFFAGILVCIFIAAYKEIRRKTVHSEKDLEHYLGTASLGSIMLAYPNRKTSKDEVITIEDDNISELFAESIRTIAVRMEKEAAKHSAQTILLTGALWGEGNTTLAVNLAMMLSKRCHRVLLVETNLRDLKSELSSGLFDNYGNLTVLEGQELQRELTDNSAEDGRTRSIRNDSIWGRGHTAHMIRSWKTQFDYVIIDAAPATVMPDASQIARSADGYIFVIRDHHANVECIEEGMRMINDAGCRRLGCVICHA